MEGMWILREILDGDLLRLGWKGQWVCESNWTPGNLEHGGMQLQRDDEQCHD